MRIATYKVFDQQVTTATTWYSSSQFNRLLGEADLYAVQVYPTNVTGTPSISVQSEYSPDGLNWLVVAPPDIPVTNLTTNVAIAGTNLGLGGSMPPAFMRLGLVLAGTSPSCRLKVHVTLHARSKKP